MKTQVTACLEGELALDLDCFLVTARCSRAWLVRQALRAFIDAELKKNAGIAGEFACAKMLRLKEQRGHLRVVK